MKRISMFTAVLLAGALAMSAPAQDDPFAGQEPASDFPRLPDIPDLASEFQHGENEGSASFSESSSSETRSVRRTERSEGGISFDFGHGASDQDWNERNTLHHSGGTVTTIDAGPIWGNDDAQGKCRSVCSDNDMGWGGAWRTVGTTSYCDCTQAGGPGFPGHDRTTSCFAPRNHQCPGCSISCSGGRHAACTQGNRGIFTGPNDTLCATKAVCECR